ncbi:MAG: D-methionine transport system ATP-binding protein [Pseudomonadota bacterium]|nr:D-methionine transport system ATP-binding protein [Pseudomonadota bacterium]
MNGVFALKRSYFWSYFLIQIQELNKSFITKKNKKSSVLKNINLEVNAGEIFGIIGKSGAGKSTLIKCLNLLEQPDSGSIVIDGVDITRVTKRELRLMRQQIGVIFQGFNLLNSKTVYDNIALPLVLQGHYSRDEINARVNSLLELVGLTAFAKKYPRSLSGGQKQRVGIARALANNPKILLSDEATSALDPQTTNSILELLLDINRQFGITVILITHEIEVIRKICDRVAVIDNGSIIECGNTVNVILHPQHELTRKLIIEEETTRYLEGVSSFYKFEKNNDNHLILISFLGVQTFEPVLSTISRDSGVIFSVLRGELGRVKHTPFGQLLVEIKGSQAQLAHCFETLNSFNLHYEVIY